MEVGAVKQAFNNEVILLKKKLNQAKIQIIHKLTRKAKQLTEKKAPENLKEKLKRKAESAVEEVFIIKKIKAKDLAKFIVTHQGELNSYLNKPEVDQDKACARLLLHRVLQDKAKFIRGRFSNVPIQDLFMSRLERRKMKKEAKEKQKNKKKGKDKKVVNSEGDWDVEDVEMGDTSKLTAEDSSDDFSGDEENDNDLSDDKNNDNVESDDEIDEEIKLNDDFEEHNDEESSVENSDSEIKQDIEEIEKPISKIKSLDCNIKSKLDKTEVKHTKTINPEDNIKIKPTKPIVKKNPEKKQKEINKHKNLNEKILQRKFKKDSDAPVVESKIVDPFFITSTGENYMSVVEPRAPDEIKEEHKQGNRKLRRAVMFGHVPKSKLRQNNNYYNEEKRFNNQNGFNNNFKSKNDRTQFNDRKNFSDSNSHNNDFNDKRGFNNRINKSNDEKEEKLHPSWEAKKKKSGILPFEGKKIVFDES